MITSDTRNWSSFSKNPSFIDPLRSNVQSPPSQAAPHVATGWIQNNRDFAANFNSTTPMFDNPQHQHIWDGSPSLFDPSKPLEPVMPTPSRDITTRTSSGYGNIRAQWDNIEARVNQNSANMLQGRSSEPMMRSGLGYNSFSDTNQISMRSGGAAGADEIAKVAQQTGQAGVNIYSAFRNQEAEKTYQANVQSSGIHGDLHANMIKNSEQSRNTISNAAGNFGAIFGPVGGLLGTVIGNAINSRVNPNSDNFKTAFSSSGKVNPQDSGIVSGNNTANMSGQSIQQV